MAPRIAFCFLCVAFVASAETIPPKLYEVVTETGMPNLEENLRYAITRERRCLSEADLSSVFPMLKHASLAGCELRDAQRDGDKLTYRLACEGGHGTTGSATWRIGAHAIQGTLNVKLGGKNMTLFQRVTAKPLGACAADATSPSASEGAWK